MGNRIEQYTGTLKYRNVDFVFSYVEGRLKLIPPKEKEDEIEWEWGRKPLGNGVSTIRERIRVEDEYLVGYCNDTGGKIVLFPERGSYLAIKGTSVTITIRACVVCKRREGLVDGVAFTCPELNYIYPLRNALSFSMPPEDGANGVYTVSTRSGDLTTTKSEKFIVDEKSVSVCFGVKKEVRFQNDEHPIWVNSSLLFEFEPTDDYGFIIRLCNIARDFLRFLCYRNNVYFDTIRLLSRVDEGLHEEFASFFFVSEEGETESVTLKKGQCIRQDLVAGHVGSILTDIATSKLYLRHLPDSYRAGRVINAARFVMITAAFEWEFQRLYPNGIKKSQKIIEAEEAVIKKIEECVESSSGRQKKIYKQLNKVVKAMDSLPSEINQVGKDFSSILDVFGNPLYSVNNQVLKYSEMGERLSTQRNHFAHGDLDQDFIGLSLLDLVYLEYVVYAMQLRYYCVEPQIIQIAINELFNLRVNL